MFVEDIERHCLKLAIDNLFCSMKNAERNIRHALSFNRLTLDEFLNETFELVFASIRPSKVKCTDPEEDPLYYLMLNTKAFKYCYSIVIMNE